MRVALGMFSFVGAIVATGLLAHRPAAPVSPVPLPDPAPGARMPARAAAVSRGFVGVVFARESVDVAARLGGRLVAVRVRLGDHIARGQSVATLDAQALPQELAAARAQVHVARADAERAELEDAQARDRLSRQRRLVGVNAAIELADAEFAEKAADARLAAARAAVAVARARIDQLDATLADAEIRAPFDGTVAARYLDGGATVAPGAPIVRLISAGDLWVRFAVPEADAPAMHPGSGVAVCVEAGGRCARGRIETVAPELDAASRTLVAEARLAAGAELIAGLVTRVRLEALDGGP